MTGAFTVGNDSAASGGHYVHVPEGFGARSSPDEGHKVTFIFNVSAQGVYRIKAWVSALDTSSNSFWVKVDGSPAGGYLWGMALGNYQAGYVTNGGGPVEVTLGVGLHTVAFYLREDGTRLDKVQLELVSGSPASTTSYYYAGSTRVAMRQGGVVSYLHGDHLGSASLTTNASGNQISEQRYYPYGATRSGSSPTDRQFNGQRNEVSLGLYDYGARFYDSSLGRFLSADTIVPSPGNPQSLNRYSYTLNNPLKFIDPTGHHEECSYGDGCGSEGTWSPPPQLDPLEMPAPATVPTMTPMPALPAQQASPDIVGAWRFVQRFIPGIELDNGVIFSIPVLGDTFSESQVSIQLSSCSTANPSPVGKFGPIFVGTPRVEVNAGNLDSVYVTAQVYDPLALRYDIRKRMELIKGVTARPEATFLTQPGLNTWQTSAAGGGTLIIGTPDAAREFSLRLIATRRDYPSRLIGGALVALAVYAPVAAPFMAISVGEFAPTFAPAFGH